MFSEDAEMSNRCPLCLEGELKFIHINLEEDVKMCMNEECVYPFQIGVVDEFVPSKIKRRKGSHNYESLAALMSKLQKEFQKDCLEWDRYADGNEFISNIDKTAAREFIEKLNEVTVKKEVDDEDNNEGFLNVDKFLDSLGESPKTSASGVGCKDPGIDTGETAGEDYFKSVISELEEMKGKICENNGTDMQWNADDFNAETFEMNDSVVKKEVISDSEDQDLNVNMSAEQEGVDVITGSHKGEHCSTVIAKKSEVQNDPCKDSTSSEERTDDIVSMSIAALADHTYCRPIVATAENKILKTENDRNTDNVNTTLEQADSDVNIGKCENFLSLSNHKHSIMHCTPTSLRMDTTAIDSEIPKKVNENVNSGEGVTDTNTQKCKDVSLISDDTNFVSNASISSNTSTTEVNSGISKNLNVNVNSGESVSDLNPEKHTDISVTSDHTNNSVHRASASVNTNTLAVETQKFINDLKFIDSYGKTIIVRCAEVIPLHHHFGSKYLKSVCDIQPPKTKGNYDSKSPQVLHMFSNMHCTSASTEGQNGLKTTAAGEQASVQLRNISEKPNASTSIHATSFTVNKEEPGSQDRTATVEQAFTQLGSDSNKLDFNGSSSTSRSSLTSSNGGPSGLETTTASVEQASAQLSNVPKKSSNAAFCRASRSRSPLTRSGMKPNGQETTTASVEQASVQQYYGPVRPDITAFNRASRSRCTSSLTPSEEEPSGQETTAASVEQASVQQYYGPVRPDITAFNRASRSRCTSYLTPSGQETADLSDEQTSAQLYDQTNPDITDSSHALRSSLTPSGEEPSGQETADLSDEQASAQLYDQTNPDITDSSYASRSSLTPSGEEPSGQETTDVSVEQASAQLYEPTSPDITDFSHASTINEAPTLPATVKVEKTCAQTSCTSEKPNDNGKGFMEKFTHLFSKNNAISSFAKFDFPEFDKTEHKMAWKHMPRTYSGPRTELKIALKQMRKTQNNFAKNKANIVAHSVKHMPHLKSE